VLVVENLVVVSGAESRNRRGYAEEGSVAGNRVATVLLMLWHATVRVDDSCVGGKACDRRGSEAEGATAVNHLAMPVPMLWRREMWRRRR